MNWQTVFCRLAVRYLIAVLAGAVSGPFWLLIAPQWLSTLGPGYTWTNWRDFLWTLAGIPAATVMCSLFLLTPFVATTIILLHSSLLQTAVWGVLTCYYVQLCFGFDILRESDRFLASEHGGSFLSLIFVTVVILGFVPILFALVIRWLVIGLRRIYLRVT